jgi:hypothetical protein
MKRFLMLLIATFTILPLAANAYVPSPRYGAFELKFGPYRPNADKTPGNEGQYSDFYGKNSSMFNTTLELDWQFARVPEIISFAVGGSFGIMREEGYAKIVDNEQENNTGSAQTSEDDSQKSSDETAINVMPFAVLAVFRIDVLADKLYIPVVPFFKVGFNWYLWWTRTSGKTTDKGGTMGWQLNAGIAIQLDWIDRMSARTFDNEVGVNHSYLFFEFLYANVDGMGSENHLHLSPTNIGSNGTWMAGLCLEF